MARGGEGEREKKGEIGRKEERKEGKREREDVADGSSRGAEGAGEMSGP